MLEQGASVGSQLKIGCRLWWASHRQRPGLPPKCLCKHHQRLPPPPIQTALGPGLLLSLRANHCPQPLPPLPCHRAVSQDRWGPCGFSVLIRLQAVGPETPSEVGLLLMRCPSECQQWLGSVTSVMTTLSPLWSCSMK